jgi:hypothetical protein
MDVRGSLESFAARLRAVASAVEPTPQIDELMPLDAAPQVILKLGEGANIGR